MNKFKITEEKKYIKKQNIYKNPLKIGKGSVLSSLDIELTERCNNNCIHCYINQPADDENLKNKELSTAEIKNILKEAVSLGCLNVRFTGGEPLLRQDFEEIYIYARKLGLRVLIFTNGCLITPHLAQLFKNIPTLEGIEITEYGMSKTSYEKATRVAGSYEKAWNGINLLLYNKLPFSVKAPIVPSFKPEIEKFEEWAYNNVKPQKETKYGVFSMSFDLRARRDSKDKNQLIKKLRLPPEETLKILTRDKEGYIKNVKEYYERCGGPVGKTLFDCGAGIQSGCVDAYGNFQMCLLLRHPKTVYNLRKGSLKDALQNFFPMARNLVTENPVYLERCAKCVLKGLCDQCPAKSWMEHGTLDTPVEYLCEISHTKARLLGFLKEGEKGWEVKVVRK